MFENNVIRNYLDLRDMK